MDDSKQIISAALKAKENKLPKRKTNTKNGKSNDAERSNGSNKGEISKLDQIRDMLFGEYAEALQNKYQSLDKSLDQNVSDLRSEIHSSIEGLKKQIDNKFDQLQKSLQTEQAQRLSENEELSNSLANVNSDILTKIDLEVKRMDDALNSQHQESSRQLNAVVDSLQEAKVDRKSLAALFNQFAKELEDS